MHPILPIALMLAFSSPQQKVHKQSDAIERDEIAQYLAKRNECDLDQIVIGPIEQFDFLGRGYKQTVVQADTCSTETAGPGFGDGDVFTRDEKGELRELEFQVPDWTKYTVLFGGIYSQFTLENGLVVVTYSDSSGRDAPLVIKYKWDSAKQRFVAVKIIAAKPYPTGYDCAKTKDDVEDAICYVESLANLDVKLAKAYKAYLSGLDTESRRQAVTEQRTWLAKRNESCPIYKDWVECLEGFYEARIAELQRQIDKTKGN